jgi:hypothetical protein
MICNLSERRSATILLISSGFCFRIAALARHALGVGSGGQADAFGFGLRQQLAAFSSRPCCR